MSNGGEITLGEETTRTIFRSLAQWLPYLWEPQGSGFRTQFCAVVPVHLYPLVGYHEEMTLMLQVGDLNIPVGAEPEWPWSLWHPVWRLYHRLCAERKRREREAEEG